MNLTLAEALQRGIAAHKEGKLEEADRFYTAILKAEPMHPDANHNMGVLAVGVGKVEQSLSFFKSAVAADPKIEQFWLSYVDALLKIDRIDDAKQLLEKASASGISENILINLQEKLNASDNKNVSLRSSLQELLELYNKGDHETALSKGMILAQRSPNDPNLLNILGAIYAALKKHDEAIRQYQKAIKLNPTNAEFHNNLGYFPKGK